MGEHLLPSDSPLRINVVIAGRTYSLHVKDAQEEEGVRKAAGSINELVAKYEQSYAVSDKQDVLAMCTLQFASKIEVNAIKEDKTQAEALQKIKELTDLLAIHLA